MHLFHMSERFREGLAGGHGWVLITYIDLDGMGTEMLDLSRLGS